MNVLQHTRNERNPCLKQNRPDRSYRDTLLTSLLPGIFACNINTLSGRESWDKREVLVKDYCSISHKILQSEILRKLSETLKRINVQIHYHQNFSLFSSNDTKILFDSCYFSLMGWFSYCCPKMRQTGRPAYNQATRQYIQFTWSLVALFDTPEVEGRGEWYIPQAHKTMTIAVAPRNDRQRLLPRPFNW